MFNLLRMDIRRLFRSRNFYIMLGVTVVLLFLLLLLVATVSDPNALDAIQSNGTEIDAVDRAMSDEIRSMSCLELAHECLHSGFLLVITGIGMTIFVNSDFSSGYIKNICFAQPRRKNYVLSKVLLAGIYSGIITVTNILVSLVFPLLLGMRPAASPILSILQYAFWMWLPNWAFGLMGLALVTLTRGSVLGIILAVLAGGGVISQMFGQLFQVLRWPNLSEYTVSSTFRSHCIPMLETWQMGMILACALGWAVVYGIGSLLIMEKRDI